MYGKLCSLYYDLQEQYATQQEIDFYAQCIQPGHKALEAMSGSGRLQIPLLLRGYSIDGIDNSPNMLERCKKRCAQLGLAPSLYEQSLEAMSLTNNYDVIFIAKGSFQLIADKHAALTALQKIRDHMHKKGMLLIDIFVPTSKTSTFYTDNVQIDDYHQIRFSAHYQFHEHQKQVDVHCTYELLADGNVQEQETEIMHFVWYTDNEFINLLNQAGFAVVQIHEVSFFAGDSSRVIECICK